jgi:hypothetical protein
MPSGLMPQDRARTNSLALEAEKFSLPFFKVTIDLSTGK